jgi:hypothetical protein
MAYQWVQARIQDIVIENESEDTKIRLDHIISFADAILRFL